MNTKHDIAAPHLTVIKINGKFTVRAVRNCLIVYEYVSAYTCREYAEADALAHMKDAEYIYGNGTEIIPC